MSQQDPFAKIDPALEGELRQKYHLSFDDIVKSFEMVESIYTPHGTDPRRNSDGSERSMGQRIEQLLTKFVENDRNGDSILFAGGQMARDYRGFSASAFDRLPREEQQKELARFVDREAEYGVAVDTAVAAFRRRENRDQGEIFNSEFPMIRAIANSYLQAKDPSLKITGPDGPPPQFSNRTLQASAPQRENLLAAPVTQSDAVLPPMAEPNSHREFLEAGHATHIGVVNGSPRQVQGALKSIVETLKAYNASGLAQGPVVAANNAVIHGLEQLGHHPQAVRQLGAMMNRFPIMGSDGRQHSLADALAHGTDQDKFKATLAVTELAAHGIRTNPAAVNQAADRQWGQYQQTLAMANKGALSEAQTQAVASTFKGQPQGQQASQAPLIITPNGISTGAVINGHYVGRT